MLSILKTYKIIWNDQLILLSTAFNDFTNRIFHRVKSGLSTSALSVKLSVYHDNQIFVDQLCVIWNINLWNYKYEIVETELIWQTCAKLRSLWSHDEYPFIALTALHEFFFFFLHIITKDVSQHETHKMYAHMHESLRKRMKQSRCMVKTIWRMVTLFGT